MRVKELIEIINTFGVKVIYDNPEEVKNNLYTNGHVLYFTPVQGKERKKYEHTNDKETFVSTTACIHMPDLSIDEVIDCYECDVTGIHEFTQNAIKPYCNKGVPDEIVYVSYLFLHEVGHWHQFTKLDKHVDKFINLDLEAEKENFNKVKCLTEQRNERLQKGNNCLLTTKEKRLFQQYMQEYRDIPKEKEADEFAYKNLLSTIETIRSSDKSCTS